MVGADVCFDLKYVVGGQSTILVFSGYAHCKVLCHKSVKVSAEKTVLKWVPVTFTAAKH